MKKKTFRVDVVTPRISVCDDCFKSWQLFCIQNALRIVLSDNTLQHLFESTSCDGVCSEYSEYVLIEIITEYFVQSAQNSIRNICEK